jgi:hypothetical protein
MIEGLSAHEYFGDWIKQNMKKYQHMKYFGV